MIESRTRLLQSVKYAPVSSTLPAQRWIILSDFDATISLEDTTDSLLERFGEEGCDELEAQWESGDIGSRECMGGQIALLKASRDELDEHLTQIHIDPDFKAFADSAQAADIPIQIVSDGLDYVISTILKRHGLGDLQVFANHLVELPNQRWKLEFPLSRADCLKASGHCKCARVSSARTGYERILYIGDGSSDFCVSNHVDVVLAKDRLIGYCQQHGIEHHPITSFKQAITLLPKILQDFENRDRESLAHPRHQLRMAFA